MTGNAAKSHRVRSKGLLCRCASCGHLKGHRPNVAPEREWTCDCDCHVFADGRELPKKLQEIRCGRRRDDERKRYEKLGCTFVA